MKSALRPGEQVLNYVIVESVGGGGFGRVYKAEHRTLGRVVALKEMIEENVAPSDLASAISDFEREARLLAALTESDKAKRFVPQIHDHFECDGRRFLAMEFVQGETLEDALRKTNAPVPWRTVVGWGIEICEALSYFHSQIPPLVFRDLKPSNIMLCSKDGRLRIIDFGIAKQFKADMSMSTRWLGSPGYAAPEQMRGRPTPQSDIYSLGATLYRLMTNRSPYPDAEDESNLPSATDVTRKLGVDVAPASVSDVLDKCMELRMGHRFGTADELRSALAGVLDGTTDFGRTQPDPLPTHSHPSKVPTTDSPVRESAKRESIGVSPPVRKGQSEKGHNPRQNDRLGSRNAIRVVVSAAILVILIVIALAVKPNAQHGTTAVLPQSSQPVNRVTAGSSNAKAAEPAAAQPLAYCPKCNVKIADNWKFCRFCGAVLPQSSQPVNRVTAGSSNSKAAEPVAPQPLVYCPKCNVKIADNWKFCRFCSADLRR